MKRLTVPQVREIRCLANAGVPGAAYAKRYGLSPAAVSRLARGSLYARLRGADITAREFTTARAWLASGGTLGEAAAAIGVTPTHLDVTLWDALGR